MSLSPPGVAHQVLHQVVSEHMVFTGNAMQKRVKNTYFLLLSSQTFWPPPTLTWPLAMNAFQR